MILGKEEAIFSRYYDELPFAKPHYYLFISRPFFILAIHQESEEVPPAVRPPPHSHSSIVRDAS